MSQDASLPGSGPGSGNVTPSQPARRSGTPDAYRPVDSQPAPGQAAPGQAAPAASTAPNKVQPAAGQPSDQAAAPSGQPAPATKGKAEHRTSPRRRVLKEGKVIFGKAQSVVDVTIDNMSEGGAHIRMLSSHGLPGEFYLAEASRGIIHRVEVAWRTATGMGLRLVGPLEDVAAREAFLRKFRRG